MPSWTPTNEWDGLDVFIIGGGNSLESFDWDLLRKEMTIGCNSAFLHGAEICKLCIFGDFKWFEKFSRELAKYKGVVFTNVPQLIKRRIPWLWTYPRKARGLHTDALGWNGNTGAAAVNLALLLGAKRIILLGFDMKLSKDGRPNWHNRVIQKPSANVYPKFVKQFEKVKSDLEKKFPGREIINVTDCSEMDLFPKVGIKEFFDERKLA